MTKLSELLAHAANGLETMAEECQARGLDRHRLYEEESRVLRAIAPALVAVAQASCTVNKTHGFLAFQGEPDECPACHLAVALKEAGVSCD